MVHKSLAELVSIDARAPLIDAKRAIIFCWLASCQGLVNGFEHGDVCIDSPGHFLSHPQTIKLMQKDYYYPHTDE